MLCRNISPKSQLLWRNSNTSLSTQTIVRGYITYNKRCGSCACSTSSLCESGGHNVICTSCMNKCTRRGLLECGNCLNQEPYMKLCMKHGDTRRAILVCNTCIQNSDFKVDRSRSTLIMASRNVKTMRDRFHSSFMYLRSEQFDTVKEVMNDRSMNHTKVPSRRSFVWEN